MVRNFASVLHFLFGNARFNLSHRKSSYCVLKYSKLSPRKFGTHKARTVFLKKFTVVSMSCASFNGFLKNRFFVSAFVGCSYFCSKLLTLCKVKSLQIKGLTSLKWQFINHRNTHVDVMHFLSTYIVLHNKSLCWLTIIATATRATSKSIPFANTRVHLYHPLHNLN